MSSHLHSYSTNKH